MRELLSPQLFASQLKRTTRHEPLPSRTPSWMGCCPARLPARVTSTVSRRAFNPWHRAWVTASSQSRPS